MSVKLREKAEQMLQGQKGPAAIINLKMFPILALGSIVSDELYHQAVPIVVLVEKDFFSIREDNHLTIEPDGTVKISTKSC